MQALFASRTADVKLPAVTGQPRVTLNAVNDDFKNQMLDNFATVVETLVLLSPRSFRVTCGSARSFEEFCNLASLFGEHLP